MIRLRGISPENGDSNGKEHGTCHGNGDYIAVNRD